MYSKADIDEILLPAPVLRVARARVESAVVEQLKKDAALEVWEDGDRYVIVRADREPTQIGVGHMKKLSELSQQGKEFVK